MPTSQNGWTASPDLPIEPLIVGGVSFLPGVRKGDVHTVLEYVARQVAKRVEAPVNPGCWGFSYRANANNPNSLSNHSSGTAIDYNAPAHPNGVPTARTFTAREVGEIHQILAEVDDVVRWGGDYKVTPDAMHFEINADAKAVRKVAKRLQNPTVRVVTFNVWVGQKGLPLRRNIRRLIRDAGRPHVIALQEAHGLKRGFFSYKRVAVKDFPREGARNNVLLVRRDLEFIRRRVLAIKGPRWVGPKHGLTHDPRVFVGGVVGINLRPWEFLSVHRATSSNGQNRATRDAEVTDLTSWVAKIRTARPHRPIVLMGDWNGKPLVLGNELGGITALQGIDGAILINAQCLSVRKLAGKYGSDNHHPVVIHLKEN